MGKFALALSCALVGLISVVSAADFDEAIILGDYSMTSDPGMKEYDEVLKCFGHNDQQRELYKKIKINLILAKSPPGYSITWKMGLISHTVKFQLGKEVEDKMPDQRTAKHTFHFKGSQMLQESKAGNEKMKVVAAFTDKGGKFVYSCKDKSVTHTFDRNKGGKLI